MTTLLVCQRQRASFRALAIVDADGTIAETTGECKEGMNMSFKCQWGYQQLVVSLANARGVLFQDLRPGIGRRTKTQQTAWTRAVDLLRGAGFEAILMRGDTAFSQTSFLDRWDADCVEFVFGIQAAETPRETAASLPDSA